MANIKINNVTYNDVPFINVPLAQGSGTAAFYDDSDADAAAGEVLSGKIFYHNGRQTGNMPNNGATGGTISAKDGSISIPSGYTSGGSVAISDAAKQSIISDNIKAGANILGVSGSASVVDTTIASDAAAAATIFNGKKAFVNGSLVTGSATIPTITQDSTTKVLSIS